MVESKVKAKTYELGLIESLERRLALMEKKRADYADEDVLANFKRLGQTVKTLRIHELWEQEPALAYALFMVVMKIDRMVNLLRQNKSPSNEAYQDTWDDAKNYLDLAEAVYLEPIAARRALAELTLPANLYKAAKAKKKL
jgi:hypothetical protein